MIDTQLLPADLAACHKIIVAQNQKIGELSHTTVTQAQAITELHQKVQSQELIINELLQRAFRNRSERYVDNPDQLRIDFGETPEAADAAEGLADAVEEAGIIIAEHKRRGRKPRKPRSEALPAHLPRREVTLEAAEEVKKCAEHGERTLIGYDRQESLEYEPPKLSVLVTLIPKYACEGEPQCGVKEAPRPKGLVEGNRYGASVAAEITTNKYNYHLPTYRQQDQFAASGWTPSRSTLLNILTATAACLRPFVEYLRKEVIASGALGTDETRVTLLLPPDIPAAIAGNAKSQRIHEVFTEAKSQGRPSARGGCGPIAA